MRRQATAVLAAVGLGLVLGAGAARAETVACPSPSVVDNPGYTGCYGTNGADTLTGTNSQAADLIYGLGGDDQLTGGAGNDQLYGDDNSVSFPDLQPSPNEDGNDRLSGGRGNDQLSGYGGNDLLAGGAGVDVINALELANQGHPAGRDTVKGGGGNDTIRANDGYQDVIDCGPGRDTVVYDAAVDVVANCEVLHPA